MVQTDNPPVVSDLMHISDVEFHSIRDIVYERFGIALTEQKRGLVVGRLQKILRQHGFKTFKEYYEHLVADKTNVAITELANQITTNHTFFFRESEHFEFFKSDILPWMVKEHKAKKNNDLRIWCAAASSGEEPYTLIITLLEYFGMDYRNWDCGLLATDISEKALVAAKRGVYDQARLQGVSPSIVNKYFRKTAEGFEVVDKVKKEVTIRKFNLMSERLPFKRQFDCIWCRNVMIYFDTPTKHALVNRMYEQTVNGGYLLIGHSETLSRDQTKWKYIKPAVYRKEE
ncbi:MAG: protein-glutamate O-methyltransferase CheR [Planctomycetaceae bacterium]|jgi:chemotaxis protein methyltransferase CheR|nr:protein-glutamate O-methyltransferase CheR [Planctomycetaceae bacterium]